MSNIPGDLILPAGDSMRASRVTTTFLSLILLMGASAARGQVVDKGWYCPADKMSGSCNGTADCDAAWQRHLDEKHGGSGGTGRRSGVHIPLSVAGGAVGALVGSATSSDDTTNVNNALMFGGGAMAVGALVDSRNMPAAGAGLLAGIGAAAATVGRGRNLEARGEREPAQTMKEAVVVGSSAAVLTFGLGALSPRLAPGLHFPKGLRIGGSARHLWVKWVW